MPLFSVAQTCSGTITASTVSTTLTGTGSTTFIFSFPQYSGPGTLLGAVVSSYATSTATVNFTNTGATSQDFFPDLARTDFSKLGGTSGTLLTHVVTSYSYNETILGPTGSGTATTSYGPIQTFSNTQVGYDSIINNSVLVSYFEGGGNVTFAYYTSTALNNVPTVVNTTSTIADQVKFYLTYYVCTPGTLSENIITFNATKQSDQTVALDWITTNEQADRKYFVELSTDGQNFTDLSSQPSDPVNSTASYISTYSIRSSDKGTLYFRIKQVNADGSPAYSEIRTISLGTTAAPGRFAIYPNPPTSSYINILFPETGLNWQVDILAADGSLVQRNAYYNNPSSQQVNFNHKLAAGTYFARATDQGTGKSHVASFVIR